MAKCLLCSHSRCSNGFGSAITLLRLSTTRCEGSEIEKWRREAPGGEWVVWKSQTCIEIYKVTTCKTGQPMFKLQSSTCKSDIQHISTGFRLNGDGSIFRVCVCVYLVWMFVKVNQFVHRKIWNSKDKTFPIFDKNSVGTRADKQQCDLMTVSGFESHSLSHLLRPFAHSFG